MNPLLSSFGSLQMISAARGRRPFLPQNAPFPTAEFPNSTSVVVLCAEEAILGEGKKRAVKAWVKEMDE